MFIQVCPHDEEITARHWSLRIARKVPPMQRTTCDDFARGRLRSQESSVKKIRFGTGWRTCLHPNHDKHRGVEVKCWYFTGYVARGGDKRGENEKVATGCK
jgi:hypothetical protein